MNKFLISISLAISIATTCQSRDHVDYQEYARLKQQLKEQAVNFATEEQFIPYAEAYLKQIGTPAALKLLNDAKEFNRYAKKIEKAFAANQWQKAVKYCSKCIVMDSTSIESWNERGRAYTSLQNYSQAIQDFSMAISLDPSEHICYKNRAEVYNALGNSAAYLADLLRAAVLGNIKAQEILKILANKTYTQQQQNHEIGLINARP
jgi:tetratricopeptide (TPR) repeat protein